jgi:hypothetical protein
MRRKLIYIIDMYGISNDWRTIAEESDEQLLDRVHILLEYYFNENQVI